MPSLAQPATSTEIELGVEPRLRRRMAAMTRDRVLVVDYFASRRCSVTVGDLTADFQPKAPGRGYMELAPIEGIRLFAEERLFAILRDAGPSLHLAGPPFARRVAVALEQPESWLLFLDQVGVFARRSALRPQP